MALPLLALIPRLIVFVKNNTLALGIGSFLGVNGWDGVERVVLDWIIAAAANRAGLELNYSDPLSDASLSNALSLRTGITFRSLKDQETVKEDVENYAVELISSKTGYQLTTLRDVERLKYDLLVIGLAVAQQKTGVPLTPPAYGSDWGPEVRSNIIEWARAQVNLEMAGDVSEMVAQISAHADLEGLAMSLNTKLLQGDSVREFTEKAIAVRIAEKLVSESVGRFQVVAAEGSKKGRRALQLREAQRKFRARWGNRSEYLPVPTVP